jgi:hypothetical protein
VRYAVYAPSYQSLFLVLFLRESKVPVHVITRNDNLYRLFTEWGFSVEKIFPFPICTLRHPLQTIRVKKICAELVESFPSDLTLFIAYNAYDIGGFLLARYWVRKGGKVVWRDLDPERHPFRFSLKIICTLHFLLAFESIMAARILLGIRLGLVGTKMPVPGITEKIAQKLGFQCEPIDNPHQFRNNVLSRAPSLKVDFKYLVLSEGPSAYSSAYMPEKYLCAVSAITTSVGGSGLKIHPALKATFLDTIAPQVPSYYPAELLFTSIRVIIGVYSAALVAAAQTRNCKVISILHLMEWRSQSAKEDAFEYFLTETKNLTNVFYPQSIEEAVDVLRKLL